MTVSIARLTAHSGVKYLLKTTMHDDVPLTPGDATGYYMKAGTPPGRWLGSGLAGISRSRLDLVTSDDASAVFTDANHPDTHQPLGRHHGETTLAHHNGEEIQRVAVAGFDLTFSVPKSVSVLWALAPHDVQQQVLAAHHDAVNQVLEWLEESAIHTRTGRGGVAHVATKGAVAAAFDHWESRARDPQLHTHVVIANRVQRATDGAWSTVDSRTLYKATVAASEHYNGLLFDRLQERLGAVPGFRPPINRVRNPRHELVGVDDALIHEFSNRTRRIDEEKDRLVQAWTQEHGRAPSPTMVVKLRQQATLSTRQAKGKEPRPLSDLASDWRSRAQRLGFEPAQVIRYTINRSHERPVTAADLTEPWVTAAAAAARLAVAHRRATWNRWNLLAEAERICAEIRCASPADRRHLIDAVTTAGESQCVALNAYRYNVPLNAGDDLVFAGHAVFEFHGTRLYTDVGILADEQLVMDTRNDDGGPAIAPDLTDTFLAQNHNSRGRAALAPDQSVAAHEVLSSGRFLDAVVGPAGSGKTTTMAAIRDGWEQVYGAGSVVGLAPAAASAEVLGRNLGLAAENVAKWLYETVGQGAAHRAEQFQDLETADPSSSWQRARTTQRMAALAMQQEQWSFRRDQLVIVDEASMVSTVQLAALVHQARDAGAKMVLVGDPAQLDAIDAGGILGWLDRQGKAVQLTSVRRFSNAWEGPASLLLRVGDVKAIQAYASHGRFHHGEYLEMIDQAYERWASDIQAGVSSILIAPDNETVTVLNERAHAELVDQGRVDAGRMVRLSDGLGAGMGDTVIARKNDRRLTDDSGDFIRNGTLVKITAKPGNDGSALGRRLDTGQSIRLSSEYLMEATELGYATTAHRSQGITVDTSHTLLTQGCLTRELFYVGMTRGQDSNSAYVCESGPCHDDELHKAPEATWLDIIGEVLLAQGAERTAHEVGNEEQGNAHSLHRLAVEYDCLAQIAAAGDLRAAVERVRPDIASSLECSPSWGAGVAAWRRATAAQPRAAAATLEHTIQRPVDANDVMAVLHARLRLVGGSTAAGNDDWLHEELSCSRPDVSDMIVQVRSLAAARVQDLKVKVMAGTDPWTRRLIDSLPDGVTAIDRNTLVERIAIYRDRWLIAEDPEPLGPPPADYEWERSNDRRQLETELARMHNTASASNKPATAKVSVAAALTNVGWDI
ncbi:relaxase domain-containing protein [Paeniglutamicibacter antarcticus]|uniref:Relaxase domain-containing protein n=1 Tax=Arthrobacter terrae TaxID=2935737 RepID=A0A931CQR8_9MICC|nr:MobF family relaxase [Arthrobacter terrae]MBG0741302.1 relaxase domain-containing protein [Arthrobacter terrae]